MENDLSDTRIDSMRSSLSFTLHSRLCSSMKNCALLLCETRPTIEWQARSTRILPISIHANTLGRCNTVPIYAVTGKANIYSKWDSNSVHLLQKKPLTRNNTVCMCCLSWRILRHIYTRWGECSNHSHIHCKLDHIAQLLHWGYIQDRTHKRLEGHISHFDSHCELSYRKDRTILNIAFQFGLVRFYAQQM